ncbi:MAG: S8 family peptidase [Magnetococcales bacterium]|nr:S8 family peptidase [Magnetococcales bacterium]
MAESYPHLPLQRETRVNEKRPGTPPRFPVPEDTRSHGRKLQQSLTRAKERAAGDVGGFDERRLFRFSVQKGFNPDDLSKISPEIEFVSQEDETVVVGFASDTALAEFESRLATMASGSDVTNKQVIYALRSVDGWSSEDRKGWALRKHGLPESDTFLLDVELWPLEDHRQEREQEWEAFERWLTQAGIHKEDQIKQSGLTLYRVRCDAIQAERLLRHRDVRSVDLPPNFGLDYSLLIQDIQKIPPITNPGQNAPGVVILDSGLATGHPLIGAAVGESDNFLPNESSAADEHGHGTRVAGLALYGDVETSLKSNLFIPTLRLFSGRILDRNKQNATGLIEKQIEAAVRYFSNEYQCRVFNLSVNDDNKPYLGGHLSGVSLTLDHLARELGVLFVVSAGNHRVDADSPKGMEWRDQYPDYLLSDSWKITEPAPALNVLTVGGLAKHNKPFTTTPDEIALAQPGQPSPFTRHGPSIGGAIKPELIAHGGNWGIKVHDIDARLLEQNHGLGVATLNLQFALGYPFSEGTGTSMAAPQVAHLAASILREHPDASASLLRALLCAHAVMPEESQALIERDKEFRKVCGYGQVDVTALHRSLESAVTLIADGSIENKRHHFYEVPIPDEFTSGGRRRLREIAVGLAYAPIVRSTRIKYRATRIDFRLVTASDLEHITTMFNKATEKDDYENIPELKTATVGQQARSKGTVQADTWRFNQFNKKSRLKKDRLFVVVTRNDFPWGEPLCATEEDYALVVCLRDRENEEARLYTQVRNQLQARMRGRAKV